MQNTATVLDTPEQISRFALRVLQSALELEIKGMKKRGQSALSIARAQGYKGNRHTIVATIKGKLAQTVL